VQAEAERRLVASPNEIANLHCISLGAFRHASRVAGRNGFFRFPLLSMFFECLTILCILTIILYFDICMLATVIVLLHVFCCLKSGDCY
jgi:hypothetical protein